MPIITLDYRKQPHDGTSLIPYAVIRAFKLHPECCPPPAILSLLGFVMPDDLTTGSRGLRHIQLSPYSTPRDMAPSSRFPSQEDANRALENYHRMQAVVEVSGGKTPEQAALRLPWHNAALRSGNLPLDQITKIAALTEKMRQGGGGSRSTLEGQIRNLSDPKQDENSDWGFSSQQQVGQTRADRLQAINAVRPQVDALVSKMAERASALTGRTVSVDEIRRFIPSLSDEQLKVVQDPSRFTNMLAGPGSGKSSTMVAQVMEDMLLRGGNPAAYKMLSKTNSAVNAFSDKLSGIESVIPAWDQARRERQSSTFDSFGLSMLNRRDPGTNQTPMEQMGLGQYKSLAPRKGSSGEEIVASQQDAMVQYVGRVLDKFGISRRHNRISELASHISTVKDNRSAQYGPAVQSGQQTYQAGTWKGQQQVDPNLVLYLYEQSLKHREGFQVQGQSSPRYDLHDVPYLVRMAARKGTIGKLQRFVIDESQDTAPEWIRALADLSGGQTRGFFGGDMGQMAIQRDWRVDELIPQAFANQGMSQHSLTGNFRSGGMDVGLLNAINALSALEGKGKSPQQIAVGSGANMPKIRMEKDFPSLYQGMISDWMKLMGTSPQQIRAAMEAGSSPFSGGSVQAGQAPFVFQMDEKSRKEFKGTLGKTLGSGGLSPDQVQDFFAQHYSEQVPSPENQDKMHALMISQIRSRSAQHVFSTTTRGGQWDFPGYLRNLYTMLSRATDQNHIYHATTNFPGSNFPNGASSFMGEQVPPGFDQLLKGMLEDTTQKQGIDPAQLTEMMQHALQLPPVMYGTSGSGGAGSPMMGDQHRAALSSFSDDALMLNQHYQSPVGSDTGVQQGDMDMVGRGSERTDDGREIGSARIRNAGMLNANVVAGRYRRGGDMTKLSLSMDAARSTVAGGSAQSVPNFSGFMGQMQQMAGPLSSQERQLHDVDMGRSGPVITPANPLSLYPAETEGLGLNHLSNKENEPSRRYSEYLPFKDPEKQNDDRGMRERGFMARDEMRLRKRINKIVQRPLMQQNPHIQELMRSRYTHPSLISGLMGITGSRMQDPQYARINHALRLSQVPLSQVQQALEELKEAGQQGPLSKVQVDRQQLMGRLLQQMQSGKGGSVYQQRIVQAIMNPQDELGYHNDNLARYVQNKVGSLISYGALTPDLMQSLITSSEGIAGSTKSTRNQQYFMRIAQMFRSHSSDIQPGQGISVSPDYLQDLMGRDPLQGQLLSELISGPHGSLRSLSDPQVFKNVEQLPYMRGAMLRKIDSPEAARRLGIPLHTSRNAPVMTQLQAYALSLEGGMRGEKGGLVDPMTLLAFPRDGQSHEDGLDEGFDFQQLGGGVPISSLISRLSDMLQHNSDNPGMMSPSMVRDVRRMYLNASHVKNMVSNPDNQGQWAHMLRVVHRATVGSDVISLDRPPEGSSHADIERFRTEHPDPIRSFFTRRTNDYMEGMRTLDSLVEFVDALSSASTSLAEQGGLRQSQLTRVLEAFGFSPSDKRFAMLQALQGKGFRPSQGDPDPMLDLQRLVGEFPSDRANVQGQLTRVPLMPGRAYAFRGGEAGFGGITQAQERLGLQSGFSGELRPYDAKTPFGLSKQLQSYRAGQMLTRPEFTYHKQGQSAGTTAMPPLFQLRRYLPGGAPLDVPVRADQLTLTSGNALRGKRGGGQRAEPELVARAQQLQGKIGQLLQAPHVREALSHDREMRHNMNALVTRNNARLSPPQVVESMPEQGQGGSHWQQFAAQVNEGRANEHAEAMGRQRMGQAAYRGMLRAGTLKIQGIVANNRVVPPTPDVIALGPASSSLNVAGSSSLATFNGEGGGNKPFSWVGADFDMGPGILLPPKDVLDAIMEEFSSSSPSLSFNYPASASLLHGEGSGAILMSHRSRAMQQPAPLPFQGSMGAHVQQAQLTRGQRGPVATATPGLPPIPSIWNTPRPPSHAPQPIDRGPAAVAARLPRRLSADQRAVVDDPTSSLTVLGGPGSGKTSTMVSRLAKMMITRQLQPDKMLAVSPMHSGVEALNTAFNRSLRPLLPGGGKSLKSAQTVHSLSHSILFQDGVFDPDQGHMFYPTMQKIGLGGVHGTLADADEEALARMTKEERASIRANGTESFLRSAIADRFQLQKPISSKRIKDLLTTIGKYKKAGGGSMSQAYDLGQHHMGEGFLSNESAFTAYQDRLRSQGLIDFDDYAPLASRALQQLGGEAIPPSLQGLQMLMVDEAQDTTPAAMGLYGSLLQAGGNKAQMLVGMDPMQGLLEDLGALPPHEVEGAYQQLYKRVGNPHGSRRISTNFRGDRSSLALSNGLLNMPQMGKQGQQSLQVPGPGAGPGRPERYMLAKSDVSLYQQMFRSMLGRTGVSPQAMRTNIGAGRHPFAGTDWSEPGMVRPNQIPAIIPTRERIKLFEHVAATELQGSLGLKNMGAAYNVMRQITRHGVPGERSGQEAIEKAVDQFPVGTPGQFRGLEFSHPYVDTTRSGGWLSDNPDRVRSYLQNMYVATSRVTRGGQNTLGASSHPFNPWQARDYRSGNAPFTETMPNNPMHGEVKLGDKNLLASPQTNFSKYGTYFVPNALFKQVLAQRDQQMKALGGSGAGTPLPGNIVNASPSSSSPSPLPLTAQVKDAHIHLAPGGSVNVSGSNPQVTVNRGNTPPPAGSRFAGKVGRSMTPEEMAFQGDELGKDHNAAGRAFFEWALNGNRGGSTPASRGLAPSSRSSTSGGAGASAGAGGATITIDATGSGSGNGASGGGGGGGHSGGIGGFNNYSSNMGRTMARIGMEMQYLDKLFGTITNEAAVQGSAYRRATLPMNASGGDGTSGYFDFASPTSGISQLQNNYPMYSKVQLAQSLQQYSSLANTQQGITGGTQSILGLSALTGMAPDQLMGQFAGITGTIGQGKNQSATQGLAGSLFGMYGGNLSSLNVSPTLSALSSALPSLQGLTLGGGSQIPQIMGLFKAAMSGGMTAQNLPDVASLLGNMSQMGSAPNLSQQYFLSKLFPGQLTAGVDMAQFQQQQVGEQYQVAQMGLQQSQIPQQISIDNAQIQLQQAQITLSAASLGLERQGYGLQQQSFGLEKQGYGLQKQSFGLEQQGLGLQYQSLGIQQQGYQSNVASYNQNLYMQNQQLGPIGGNTGRSSYFDFMRNQQAAGYNPLSAETGTQFKASAPQGLQNMQFYAGIEHQRQDMVLSRSPLLSDAKFQENMKYLNEQEAFYQKNLDLQNQQRQFEKDQGAQQLQREAESLNIQKQQLDLQGKNMGIQGQQLDLQGKNLDIQGQQLGLQGKNIDIQGQQLGLEKQRAALDAQRNAMQIQQLSLEQKFLPAQIGALQALMGAQRQQLSGMGPINGQNVQPIDILRQMTKMNDSALKPLIQASRMSPADQNSLLLLVHGIQKDGGVDKVMKGATSTDKNLQAQINKFTKQGAFTDQSAAAAIQDAFLNFAGKGGSWTEFVKAFDQGNKNWKDIATALSSLAPTMKQLSNTMQIMGPVLVGLGTMLNLAGLGQAVLGTKAGGAVAGAVGKGIGGFLSSPLGAVAGPVGLAVGEGIGGWLNYNSANYDPRNKQKQSLGQSLLGSLGAAVLPGVKAGQDLHWAWDLLTSSKVRDQTIPGLNGILGMLGGHGSQHATINTGRGMSIGAVAPGVGNFSPQKTFDAVFGLNSPMGKSASSLFDPKSKSSVNNMFGSLTQGIAKNAGTFWTDTIVKSWAKHTSDLSKWSGTFWNTVGPNAWGGWLGGLKKTSDNVWNNVMVKGWNGAMATANANFGQMGAWWNKNVGAQLTSFFGGIGSWWNKNVSATFANISSGVTSGASFLFTKTLPDFFTKTLPASIQNWFNGFTKSLTSTNLLGGLLGGGASGGGGANHLGISSPGVNADFHAKMNYGVHQGVDLAAAQGTPLKEFIGGKVTNTGFYDWGGEVDVAIPGGITERYLHLSQIGVRAGDAVGRGHPIGLTGGGTPASGLGYWSSGAHSHVQYDMGNINAGIDPWAVWKIFGDTNLNQFYGGAGGGAGGANTHMAMGGIVTARTRAELGELEPEAVIPLSKLAGVMKSLPLTGANAATPSASGGAGSGSGSANGMNIHNLIGHIHLNVGSSGKMSEHEQDDLMAQMIDIVSEAAKQLAGKLQ